MRIEDAGLRVQVDLTTCRLPMPRAPRCPACDAEWPEFAKSCAHCGVSDVDALELVTRYIAEADAMRRHDREAFAWELAA